MIWGYDLDLFLVAVGIMAVTLASGITAWVLSIRKKREYERRAKEMPSRPWCWGRRWPEGIQR